MGPSVERALRRGLFERHALVDGFLVVREGRVVEPFEFIELRERDVDPAPAGAIRLDAVELRPKIADGRGASASLKDSSQGMRNLRC